MTLRLSILLLGILLLISCDDMFDGGEIVTSDYKPELNVYGFISFDDHKSSFVSVYRTLSLDENPRIDSLYMVSDADVSIIDSSGISTLFGENENTYNPSFYGEPDGFVPQFDADFKLEVNAPNGLSLTGTLHTTPKPELLNQIQEMIYPDSFFTIKWNSPENAMIRIEVESSNHPGCYIHKSEYFESGETEWKTKIFSCYDNQREYYSGNPDSLTIQLTFMDINYYEYFIKYDEDEFLNFLMGISGSTRYAFGVEGGLGVFGSYATDKINLRFDPP